MAENNTQINDEEPLLGQPGDALQTGGKPLYHNLVIGTGVVAQVGVWIVSDHRSRPTALQEDWLDTEHPQLVAIVWGSVFSHDLILFSAHPVRRLRHQPSSRPSTLLTPGTYPLSS